MCGHVAIITEMSPHYNTIESTLQFDDVEVVPGFLPLLRVVERSHMWSRKRSGRRPGNEARPLMDLPLPMPTEVRYE